VIGRAQELYDVKIHAVGRRDSGRGFRDFVSRYRDAAERLRKGELDAAFPPNCFAPRRQFVPRRRESEPRARGPDPPVPS